MLGLKGFMVLQLKLEFKHTSQYATLPRPCPCGSESGFTMYTLGGFTSVLFSSSLFLPCCPEEVNENNLNILFAVKLIIVKSGSMEAAFIL